MTLPPPKLARKMLIDGAMTENNRPSKMTVRLGSMSVLLTIFLVAGCTPPFGPDTTATDDAEVPSDSDDGAADTPSPSMTVAGMLWTGDGAAAASVVPAVGSAKTSIDQVADEVVAVPITDGSFRIGNIRAARMSPIDAEGAFVLDLPAQPLEDIDGTVSAWLLMAVDNVAVGFERTDSMAKQAANLWVNDKGDGYIEAVTVCLFGGPLTACQESYPSPDLAEFHDVHSKFSWWGTDLDVESVADGTTRIEVYPPSELTYDGRSWGPDQPFTNSGTLMRENRDGGSIFLDFDGGLSAA